MIVGVGPAITPWAPLWHLAPLGRPQGAGPTIGPMDGSLVAQSTFGGGAPARTG